jgi:hypothetical protein
MLSSPHSPDYFFRTNNPLDKMYKKNITHITPNSTPYESKYPMTKSALLFGLEYLGRPGELKGCKRDAEEFANFLKDKKGYDKVKVCTSDSETGAQFMIYKIYKLAIKTWQTPIQEVCIFYSGHGSSFPDYNRDEFDGKDECLIPTDYRRAGVITDDLLKRVLRYFHPKTNVVFICDACHSGSMCDLKYKFDEKTKKSVVAHHSSKCRARITSISGCKDDQVSYVGFNLRGENQRRSVLTTFLLKTLDHDQKNSLHDVSKTLSNHVKLSGFNQNPEVMTSFNVQDNDPLFL